MDRTVRPAIAVIGILLIAANLRASITTIGPVLGQVRADIGLSTVAASGLISVPLLAFAAFSPGMPAVARKLGLERTIGASLVLLAAGILARSIPGTVWLWSGTVALGIAIAALNVLLPSVVKRDFPLEIGRLTGVYSAVQTGFAAVAAGLAVPIAGVSDSGWRLAYGIWAGLALIAFAFFLPRLRAPKEVPAALGTEARTGAAAAGRTPWTQALAWQVTLFMGLQSTIFFVVVTWMPEIEASVGIAAVTAGWHQSMFQVLGIAGTLTAAWLLQRFKHDQRGAVIMYSLASALGVAGTILAPALMLLWICLIGFAQGGLIVLSLALFGLRARDHRAAASLSGMAQSVGYLLAAAGPIVLGAVHDATGTWKAPLLVMLGIIVAQLISGMLAGRNRTLR